MDREFMSEEEFEEWERHQNEIDQSVLAALKPAAQNMAEELDQVEGEVLVTKAVVVFQYVNGEGEQIWGYRKVDAGWFDVGGALKMLEAAHHTAWMQREFEEDDEV